MCTAYQEQSAMMRPVSPPGPHVASPAVAARLLLLSRVQLLRPTAVVRQPLDRCVSIIIGQLRKYAALAFCVS